MLASMDHRKLPYFSPQGGNLYRKDTSHSTENFFDSFPVIDLSEGKRQLFLTQLFGEVLVGNVLWFVMNSNIFLIFLLYFVHFWNKLSDIGALFLYFSFFRKHRLVERSDFRAKFK